MLGSAFMLCHNLKTLETFLATECKTARSSIESLMKGTVLSEYAPEEKLEKPTAIIPFTSYAGTTDTEEKNAPPQVFSDMYSVLRGSDSLLLFSFVPARREYLHLVKKKVEHELSGKELRLTKFVGEALAASSSGSIQTELYYGSEERKLMLSMLNTINEAMIENGISYLVSIIISSPSEKAMQYLKSRAFILESFSLGATDLSSAFYESPKLSALPFSRRHSSQMLNFSERIRTKSAVPTAFSKSHGEVILGTYIDSSLYDTGEDVQMPRENLNLGLIISGLPGTGKSLAAMSILRQVMGAERPLSAVISPTGEWNATGKGLGMEVVTIYGEGFPINFFRCSPQINVERFYENLAMLMASASGAGPYCGPMEKCLLAAFRKVYAKTLDPDPTEVYNEIEEVVIERHAKRSNTGIKYTKHGENIIAGLESLRLMLFKRQFAYPGGTDFLGLLRKGVVFDLSLASNNMKPFFYALILNQVYGFADTLNILGDNALRMFICIEEAQLIFDDEEQSAASLDLRQRIQDFRKKGICLVLLTHSVNDIGVGIRRLCQTKLYFRQSSDSVRHAVNDLVFDQELSEAVADRLKTLEQRTCAASYMTINNGSKEPASPIFIRLPKINQQLGTPPDAMPSDKAKERATLITLTGRDGNPASGYKVELLYVGERIFSGASDQSGRISIDGLLNGKCYKLSVLGARKKDTKSFFILGSENHSIRLD